MDEIPARVITPQDLILLRMVDLMAKIESTDASAETDIEFAEMVAWGWK